MQMKHRPKFLNLFTLAPKMSITAKISILHRLSGLLLFLSIPFMLFLFSKSLTSHDFYTAFYGVMTSPVCKLIYIVLIWAMMHHMCAGVRFLFLDIHKGIERATAKNTAWVVIVVSLILTIILGVMIW